MNNSNRQHCFYDNKTGKQINYINFESLKEEHPKGDYYVIGELSIKDQNDEGTIKKILEEDVEIHIKPIGTYKESKYKTLGYIPCENNEYIAVKKRSYTKIIAIFLTVLMAVLVLLGGFFFKNNEKQDIDPNAGDYSSALKRPDNIDESQILVPGYGKFTIKKESDTIDTAFFNPEGNPCFFKFTLIEKSTNEILYESKLVPPGKGVTPIKLNKTFNEIGSYDAILKFKSFDLEDTTIQYNGSDIEVKLNVVE